MVKAASPQDARQIVDIHMRAFKGFFLTSLGSPVLRLYYRELLKWRDGCGVVYVEYGRIRGFAVGVIDLSTFYRHLLGTRGWEFGIYALPRIWRVPGLLSRVFRGMNGPRQANRQARAATLTSIAVEPGLQGRHVGRQLVCAFLEEMRHRGVEEVNLTTDRHDNTPVNKFYENLGFLLRNVYTTSGGREINEYAMNLVPTKEDK